MAVHDSLEVADGSLDDDGRLRRTGTLWSCVAHIITAVIGSGVLSLAWSTAQLGWIAGPGSLLCFAMVTYISAFLLSDCYRAPDPVKGTRNCSYMAAVRVLLGPKRMWVCGLLQYLSMYGSDIAYVITTATCMRAIGKSNCYHREGHNARCHYGSNFYMLLFGIIQIVMSLIPDIHNMKWLSVVAAIMSICYSSIGLGLGFAKVIENGRIAGGIAGVPAAKAEKKLWNALEALGDIAFAYPYSLILLEIQDTLGSPPPENQSMKRASMIAIFITTFFYFCCGCFGYAAFGDGTPGNLLTGIVNGEGFFEPFWLVDFANMCIIIHLVGGYQMYSQPIFAAAERWFSSTCPNSRFVNKFYTFRLPLVPAIRMNLCSLCFRTVFVISTTGIAMVFPYFNSVLGVLGALNFWPLAIYFPVEMYFVQKKIGAWTRKWVILRTFSFVCFLVTVLSFIGSFEALISAKLS
ncbi:Aa_trans domain-containing protein [Psidium guajava]|nr:Aa_trans domain-containing protein [Psidium guajava]